MSDDFQDYSMQSCLQNKFCQTYKIKNGKNCEKNAKYLFLNNKVNP